MYGTGQISIAKRSWWHFRRRYRWQQAYTDCAYHGSAGYAASVEGCRQAAIAADTQHAMHHARLVQRANYPGRIRTDS
jgi:hypothetical protein